MTSINTETPFQHVPSTVSEEYQQFLSLATPVGGIPVTEESVEVIRGGFAQFCQSDHDKAIEAHVEKMERVTLGNVDVTVLTPKDYEVKTKFKNIMVYVHGGAFTLGSPDHLAQIYAPVGHIANLKTYAVHYKKAPEFPFPAGLNDLLTVYRELLKTHKAVQVYFLGDSAGGNLILSMLQKARDEEGLPMPGAIGLFSPCADVEKNGDTLYTLAGRSPVLDYEKSFAPNLEAYVQDGTDLSDPMLSPINGSFKKFPPTMIVSGTRDALLSDCVRLEKKMRREGVTTELDIYDGMGHGFQQMYSLPEAEESREIMADFFKRTRNLQIGKGNHRSYGGDIDFAYLNMFGEGMDI